MPNPIYLPQNPRALGNIIGPAAQQSSNFLWQMLGQNLQNRYLQQQMMEQRKYQEQQAETEFGRDLYKLQVGAALKPGPQPSAALQGYNQAKADGFKGTFLEYQQKIAEAKSTKLNLTTNVGMEKGTKSSIEKGLVDVQNSLGRVKNIIGLYKKNYLEFGTKAQNAWNAAKEKFRIGKNISPEDKKQLADYTTFRAESVANINEEIHRLTGAQMSRWEAKRIMAGLPNAGTGLFGGDSPTEFESKIGNTYTNLLKVQARYQWYLNKGLSEPEIQKMINSGRAITLGGIMSKIDERGIELEKQLREKNKGISTPELKSQVKDILKSEFGWEF